MFTHSLRSLLLNASMKALSVGLPGREKSSVTPLLISPEIHVSRDELAAIVHPDGLRIAHLPARCLERRDDVLAAVAEPRVDHRRESAERVDHGQNPQLAARRKLIMDEVHGPHIVVTDRRRAILPQLRRHPPLGRLVAQLQAQLPLKPVDLLCIHDPAFPAQDVINTTIAVADVRLADGLDTLLDRGRIGATGLVVVARGVERQDLARPTDRHAPVRQHPADQLSLPIRPQSFRRTIS